MSAADVSWREVMELFRQRNACVVQLETTLSDASTLETKRAKTQSDCAQ